MTPSLRDGLVVASHRRHFAVRADDGSIVNCVLKGRTLTLACGDRVRFESAASGGAIVAIEPRTTLFYRSDAFKEKLIAANVTQVIGVVAPDISVDEELVNRWLVAAEDQQCRMVLVANKADRPGFPALLDRLDAFAALGYPVVPVAAITDIAPLLPWLDGHRSALVGQSGMGKSTILNAVIPGASARTAEVSAALEAGRHTTTHSTLYPLPATMTQGWIVDSPGVKAFGLAHIAPDSIAEAFVEMRPYFGRCRFRDCSHGSEPDCALRGAIASGGIAPHRLELMRSLITESKAARAPGRRS